MKKTKRLLLAMGVMATLANTAYAEEVLPTYDLDTTVVTATKSEEKLLHTSADVSVITGKEIEKMHYKTLTEALKTVPNVQILNYANAYSRNKILINGDENVIVLLNGVRVSQTDSGTLSMNYGLNLVRDMDNIQKIEVLKGAASVTYGSNAKGGVINIITKKPVETSTKIKTEIGGFGVRNYSISHNQRLDDKRGVSLWAQKNKSGDYVDGAGKNRHSSSDGQSYGLTYVQKVGKDDSGEISLNYDKTDYDYIFQDNSKRYKQYIKSNQKDEKIQLSYNQNFDKGWNNKLTYSKTYTKDQFTQYNVVNNKIDFSTPEDWGTDDLSTQIINNTTTKTFDENNKLIFGYENVLSINHLKSGQKAKINSFFAQYDWHINDKWEILSGYRYDKFKNSRGRNFRGHNSKSYTVTYNFDDKTNMYGAYNEFFKAPEAKLLYGSGYSNPELIPEQGDNKEIGINHMTKDGTLINAHYFIRNSKNTVGWNKRDRKKGSKPHYVNTNEQAHGIDLNVMKQLNDKWSAKLGYAHLFVFDEGGNYHIGYLPKNTITVETTYKYKKVEAGFNARAFLGRMGKEVDYKGWPSGRYWVANLAVNYKPEKDMKVYLKVNNMFNRLYAYHTDAIFDGSNPGDWYGMPGRNIGIGMEFKF